MYQKALQWEVNNRHKDVGVSAKLSILIKEGRRRGRDWSSNKGHAAGSDQEGEERRRKKLKVGGHKKLPDKIFKAWMQKKLCLKCRPGEHFAGKCPQNDQKEWWGLGSGGCFRALKMLSGSFLWPPNLDSQFRRGKRYRFGTSQNSIAKIARPSR